MNVFGNTLNKVVHSGATKNIIKKLGDPKALAPVILLEGTVIAGRTLQAYQRGGYVEARERITEESLTAAIWLFGISALNKIADSALKMAGLKHITTDLGKDYVTDPFSKIAKMKKNQKIGKFNFKKLISTVKLTKIAACSALGIYLVGSVIPRFNQALTAKIMTEEPESFVQTKKTKAYNPVYTGHTNKNNPMPANKMNDFLNKAKQQTVSFGNSIADLAQHAAHCLEKGTKTKLLTIDAGIMAGRSAHARNCDERNEIIFRDLASIYFYMFSTPHITKFLANNVDKYKGRNSNVAPETAQLLNDKMIEVLKANTNKDGTVNVENFKKAILNADKNNTAAKLDLFKNGNYKEITYSFDDFIKLLKEKDAIKGLDVEFMQKRFNLIASMNEAKSLAKEKFITASQVDDMFNGGLLHDMGDGTKQNKGFVRELLNNATSQETFFTRWFSCNPPKSKFEDEKKFVAQKDIDSIRKHSKDYVEVIFEQIEKLSEKKVQNIEKLMEQLKTRNTLAKTAYVFTGLAISALALSTVIPKVQYLITKIRTGEDSFPGVKGLKD